MQRRFFHFASTLWLLLFAGLGAAPAMAQIHAIAAAAPVKSAPQPADSPIMTSLALNLCVDQSALYPCPDPITSDNVYRPMIALTYGQILNGVIVYGPADLATGTITLYKDPGTGPVPVCVIAIGVDKSCPPNSTIFDAGNYTLTAALTFPNGGNYNESDAAPVNVSVSKDTSEAAVTSSQPVATLGSQVVISATATGGYGAIPDGQVIFTIDNNVLSPTDLDANGVASFTALNLSLGTHIITASYPGSVNFYPAADSPPFKQQIVPPPSVTAVTSNLNPSAVGDNVFFTANIMTGSGVSGGLSGTVTFRDGSVAFATRPVTQRGNQYMAQASIGTLGFGSHSITATYSGDGSNTASVSPVYVQQVNYPLKPTPPGYNITVTPSPLVMGVGQTADLTVTVTPISGYSAEVTLSCADLPYESACTFGNPVIPAGGGRTTLSFSTMAPHDCGSNTPYFTGQASLRHPIDSGLRYAVPLLAGVLLLLLPRHRRITRWMRPLLALVFACGLLAMNGCGGTCTDFGTNPGGYTIKVNGTSATSATDPTAVNVSTSVAVSVKL